VNINSLVGNCLARVFTPAIYCFHQGEAEVSQSEIAGKFFALTYGMFGGTMAANSMTMIR
jgi:hypothetical protein